MTLRAGAISLVVLYHALTVPFGENATRLVSGVGAHLGESLCAFVATVWRALPRMDQGVIVFFVVSGYFAFRAYQRSQLGSRQQPRREFVAFFLWRRFWRLVPVFWVALLLSYFVGFDQPFSWDGLRKLAVNASLLKTLYPGYFYSVNHAHWYVAVQWQLDLLYPLFLFIVARRSVGFAVSIAWILSILFMFVVPQFSDAAYLRFWPVRWWAEWSLGVYLAHRHRNGKRVFARPGWTITGTIVAAMVGHVMGIRVIEWLAVRLLIGAAFEALLLSRSARRSWERRIAPIGVCSYSLYLLHIPVQQLVARAARMLGMPIHSLGPWLIFAGGSFVLALGLAKWATEFIENRTAALGNRLWRRRARWRQRARERGGWVLDLLTAGSRT